MKNIEEILNRAIEKINSGEIEKDGPIQSEYPYPLNISNILYIAQGIIENEIKEKTEREDLWNQLEKWNTLLDIEKLLD